jgi:hypothetical protein
VRVGRERLRQILHAAGITFQRTRAWKESTDPDRDAKLDRIEYVTTHFPGRCLAFDQFGPLSIRPCHGASWAARKRPARLPATYHRTQGIRYFHGCYSFGGVVEDGERGANGVAGGSLGGIQDPRLLPPCGSPGKSGACTERDIWVRAGKDDVG